MEATDTLTPRHLAQTLQEPNTPLLARILKAFGPERCTQFLAETLTILQAGGMPTRDGTRIRTPGGTFLRLCKDACGGPERHQLFWSEQRPKDAASRAHRAPKTPTVPFTFTLTIWRGLTPMQTTATLKLVLRQMPETSTKDEYVFAALQNRPAGVPKGLSLDATPLYLACPRKQWQTACTKAEQIRAAGVPALFILECQTGLKDGHLLAIVKTIQPIEGTAPASASPSV